jgi:hypothetical protein
MAAARARIAAAISLSAGPLSTIREVLDAAGLASLVDEVETTKVKMTHD